MKTVAEKLTKLIEDKDFSFGYLSEKTGIPKSAIHRYASGETTNIPIDRIALLADVLGSSPEYILGWEDNNTNSPIMKKSHAIKVPVLGVVPAGIPIEAVENIIDHEEITQELASTGEFFALKIKGDSMSPRILDGDVVIVRKQSNIDSGEVAIVMVNGYDATCKKVLIKDNGIALQPLNPQFDTAFYTPKEIEELPVHIIGKVVELRGKF